MKCVKTLGGLQAQYALVALTDVVCVTLEKKYNDVSEKYRELQIRHFEKSDQWVSDIRYLNFHTFLGNLFYITSSVMSMRY
jgi:hypothetical protein